MVRHGQQPQKAHPWPKTPRFDSLIDKICSAIFAVAVYKKEKGREGEGREGKGRYTMSQSYILATCGADTPGPILIKIGMRVASRVSRHDLNMQIS